LLGFVDDVRELLRNKAVLISPILSGSGVRVKLLEAFASGIAVVSTRLGAEGLAHVSGECCELADTPSDFAAAVVRLLADSRYASALATRARAFVERERDSVVATRKLVETYRQEVASRRPGTQSPQVEAVRQRVNSAP
jgi:glycosyltransferase involved in cell wall biosynthesis